MQCIINAGTCLYNLSGQCRDKPAPEDLGCLGIVCANIVTGKEVDPVGMVFNYCSAADICSSKAAQDSLVLATG